MIRFRTTIELGVSMLLLSAANRTAAGVAAGDEVEVGIELDTAERTVEVPADLGAALDAATGARAAFDALSFSRQRERVQSVESAKKPETRQRRVEKIVGELER